MKRAQLALVASAMVVGVSLATSAIAACSFYREPGFKGLALTLNPDMREERLRAHMPTVGSLKASPGCRATLYGEESQGFAGAARRVSEPYRSASIAASCDCGGLAPPVEAKTGPEEEPKDEPGAVAAGTETESRIGASAKTVEPPTAAALADAPVEEDARVVKRPSDDEVVEPERIEETRVERPALAHAPAEAPRPGASRDGQRFEAAPESAPGSAVAAATGGFEGCRLFSSGGFGGDVFEMAPGESLVDLRRHGFDNRAASVATSAGCEITLFSHPDFRGPSAVWGGEAATLASDLRRHASSASCDCGPSAPERYGAREEGLERYAATPPRGAADYGGMRPPPPLDARGAACLIYREPGFSGPWSAYRAGAAEQGFGPALDRSVSSVEVAPGCVAVLDLGDGITAEIESSLDFLDRRSSESALSMSCYCR